MPMVLTKTCVVLLGASDYPDYTELDNSSLYTSAMALKDYFLQTAELDAEPRYLLDLFNSRANNTQQMQLMGDHLEKFSADAEDYIQNIFIIYLGHGLPQADTTTLSIAATSKKAPSLTALKVQDLADEVKKLAAWSRRFVILDCCYAAGALKPWLDADGGLAKTTEQAFEHHETREERENPRRGTTVLCASDKYSRAMAPIGKSYTLFSGALLDVLRNGRVGGPNMMTFRNLVDIVSEKLRANGEGPMPVLVSPDTTEGDLGQLLRLFPNRAIANSGHPILKPTWWDILWKKLVKHSLKIGILSFASLGALFGVSYFEHRPDDHDVQSNEPSNPQRPFERIFPNKVGATNLQFNELANLQGKFEQLDSNGFRITATTPNWLIGTSYGHPPPYIYFVRDSNESKPMKGEILISANGRKFMLDSAELYSSTEKTPYSFKGFIGERTVFAFSGVAPNSYGAFQRISNPHAEVAADHVTILLETFTEGSVGNPVGIDNIHVRILEK